MGKIEINGYRLRHFSDGTRQYRVHLDEYDSDWSRPCSEQAWGTIILAAQGGSIPQFRSALVAAFGQAWVDSLPTYTKTQQLVIVQVMQDVSTL
jgi:hypothetical protein